MTTEKKTKKELLIENLMKYGLSEFESRAYLSLLDFKEASVLSLSKSTGIKRTTTYHVIDLLIEKGLVKATMKKSKKFFNPEHPDKLVGLLEWKKESIRHVLPALIAQYSLPEESGSVEYFDGVMGIKNIYNTILENLDSAEDYFVISNEEDWKDTDSIFLEKFVEKRMRLGIKPKLLLVNNESGQRRCKYQKNYLEEIKLLPDGTDLKTNMVILKDSVIFHQLSNPVHALIIKTPSIVRAQKELFMIAWKSIQ